MVAVELGWLEQYGGDVGVEPPVRETGERAGRHRSGHLVVFPFRCAGPARRGLVQPAACASSLSPSHMPKIFLFSGCSIVHGGLSLVVRSFLFSVLLLVVRSPPPWHAGTFLLRLIWLFSCHVTYGVVWFLRGRA